MNHVNANNTSQTFNLLFFVVMIGFAIGRIRIHKVTFGITGILFAAILVGALIKAFLGAAVAVGRYGKYNENI